MTTREERMVAKLHARWSGYTISLSQTWLTRAGEPGLLITGRYTLAVYSNGFTETIFCNNDHNLPYLVDQAHQALKAHELATADPVPASK